MERHHGRHQHEPPAARRAPYLRRCAQEVIEVTDPASVDESKLFANGAVVDAIGVGVAQSARNGWLSGRIYLVILYARYFEHPGVTRTLAR